jgi:hypothetical protein
VDVEWAGRWGSGASIKPDVVLPDQGMSLPVRIRGQPFRERRRLRRVARAAVRAQRTGARRPTTEGAARPRHHAVADHAADLRRGLRGGPMRSRPGGGRASTAGQLDRHEDERNKGLAHGSSPHWTGGRRTLVQSMTSAHPIQTPRASSSLSTNPQGDTTAKAQPFTGSAQRDIDGVSQDGTRLLQDERRPS